MKIVAFRDRETGAYPIADYTARRRFNGLLPDVLLPEHFKLLGVDPVYETVRPTESEEFFEIWEGDPVLQDDIWVQQWLIREYEQPDETTIVEVSMRQARAALIEADLFELADKALKAMPGKEGQRALNEWEYATTLRRDHPLVAAIGHLLGLSEEAKDELFRMAATL